MAPALPSSPGPTGEVADAANAIDASGIRNRCIGALGGERLQARRRRQVCLDRADVGPHRQHVLVYHLGGARRVERFYEGRPSGRIDHLGTTTVMPAGRASQWRFDEVEVLHICMDADRLARMAERDFGVDPAGLEIVDRLGVDDPVGRAFAEAILGEMDQPSPMSRLVADALEQAVGLHLLSRYAHAPGAAFRPRPVLGASDLRLVRAVEYIEAHLEREVTLEDLAGVACLSTFHFSRCFRLGLGETPHAYLLGRRVQRANRMLSATAFSLSEIAYACGFASQSHFTKAFKQRTGFTPGAYRRETT